VMVARNPRPCVSTSVPEDARAITPCGGMTSMLICRDRGSERAMTCAAKVAVQIRRRPERTGFVERYRVAFVRFRAGRDQFAQTAIVIVSKKSANDG